MQTDKNHFAPTPEFSIIIVNWNTKNHLFNCLSTLYNSPPELHFETIVVDNNSEDGSSIMVKKKFPEVKLIQSNTNLGFGKGNQLGLVQAKGQFIASINPDIIVTLKTLIDLLHFLKKYPKIGLVGPTIKGLENDIQSGAEYLPDVLSGIVFFPFFGKLYRKRWAARRNKLNATKCDWVRGPFMLFRKSALLKIGGFPTQTFMYGEEMLLGYALKKSNYDVWYLPEHTVVHDTSAGARKRWKKNERSVLIRKSRMVVMKTLYSPSYFFLWNIMSYMGLLCQRMAFTTTTSAKKRELNQLLCNVHSQKLF